MFTDHRPAGFRGEPRHNMGGKDGQSRRRRQEVAVRGRGPSAPPLPPAEALLWEHFYVSVTKLSPGSAHQGLLSSLHQEN